MRNAVDTALTAAGRSAATVAVASCSALRVESLPFGAEHCLHILSNVGSGPGTAGFGTTGISDFGAEGYLRYKPVSAACDWSLVNPGGPLPVSPIFHPKQVDQANNAAAYVLFTTGWFDITGNLATLSPTASFWELVGVPTDPHRFFLGINVGAFRTDHAEAVYPVWYRWMEGLPAVVDAMNLELSADGLAQPKMRIATYGRGFWERTVEPATFLFADGFESGGTTTWSATTP